MKPGILRMILALILVADIGYSFVQHYHVALDGDMSSVIVPSKIFVQVLGDPLGLGVLLNGESYGAPNRFFAHWTMYKYFRTVPGLLQSIVSPIDSIYLSCAIAKTAIQAFLVFLIASCISGVGKVWKKEFLLAAVLIIPFFQTFGYHGKMGIIDLSITYTFFYALPLALLLLFFLPFFRSSYHERPVKLSYIQKAGLIVLAFVVSFNGPLVPGVVLIVCPLFLLNLWWKNYRLSPGGPSLSNALSAVGKIDKNSLFFFGLLTCLSLYSLYIGTHNIENISDVSLLERYGRVPEGLFNMLTSNLGIPLLIILISFNAYLIQKVENDKGKRLLTALKWMGIFTIIYLLLLPLGGYREYRPNIVRRDTVMPVIFCLIFLSAASSYFLIHHITPKYKTLYTGLVAVIFLIYTNADRPRWDHNACERRGLEHIIHSSASTVLLDNDCPVLSWHKLEDSAKSEANAKLLQIWGITKEKKLYYQR